MRCGLGIRIAILIAISDTLIPTARRHCSASAERTRETTEHRTAVSTLATGLALRPTRCTCNGYTIFCLLCDELDRLH